jgi:purine-nucleoside phosphorylase
MEVAALYAFARSAGVQALCLAHVTNTMGQVGDDFEKARRMAREMPWSR